MCLLDIYQQYHKILFKISFFLAHMAAQPPPNNGWGSFIKRTLSFASTVDEEEERARRRNELRKFGIELRQQKEALIAQIEVENRVYMEMLRLSKGNRASPFAKKAIEAKSKIDETTKQIATIDSRLLPVTELLRAATVRNDDKKFYHLMNDLAVAETTNTNGPSNEKMARMMQIASSVVSSTDSIESELNRIPIGDLKNRAEEDSSFAADYAMACSQAESASAAAASSETYTQDAIAAELISRRLRHGYAQDLPESFKALSHYPLP